ncbi:MAG: thioredoxin [Anaerofustis sp.]
MFDSKVIHVNDENFVSEVLLSAKPVLVDFWAEWCGPCKRLGPTIEELSNEISTVKVCKLNVDDARETAMKYNVMSIPTVIFFKNGEIVAQEVGLQGKAHYLEIIQKL